MTLREDRSIGMYILLSIVTCGIYGYWFIYQMSVDANTLCEGDGKKTPGLAQFILLSIVTCGIYSLVYQYSLGNRLAENAPRYGISFQENGTTVLMWNLFGCCLCGIGPFVAMNILMKNMNALSRRYNQNLNTNMGNMNNMGMNNSNAQNMGVQNNNIPVNNSNISSEGSIQVLNGSMQGVVLTIKNGEVLNIGRNPQQASLILENQEISGLHCSISYSGNENKYYVTDFSSNGTFMQNGTRLQKGASTPVERQSVIYLVNANCSIKLL